MKYLKTYEELDSVGKELFTKEQQDEIIKHSSNTPMEFKGGSYILINIGSEANPQYLTVIISKEGEKYTLSYTDLNAPSNVNNKFSLFAFSLEEIGQVINHLYNKNKIK